MLYIHVPVQSPFKTSTIYLVGFYSKRDERDCIGGIQEFETLQMTSLIRHIQIVNLSVFVSVFFFFNLSHFIQDDLTNFHVPKLVSNAQTNCKFFHPFFQIIALFNHI